MLENNNPDINVDEIMAKVRAEIEGRSEQGAIKALPGQQGKQRPASSSNWQQFQSILRAAETNADIVNPDLPMARYPKSVRWLARMTGRLILYLSRFVTMRQTNFNHLVLQSISGFVQILQTYENGIADLNQSLRKCQQETTAVNRRLQEHDQELTAVNRRLAVIEELENNICQLRTDYVLLERQFGNLLEEAGKHLPEQVDEQELKLFAETKTHQLDAFYVKFTDRFRGSREDIRERLKVYLPIVQDNNLGTSETPVLDLGCGRGEWLEILKEENLAARGVDLNQVFIENCRQNELEVFESDIFDYLRSVSDQNFGAVTAFHLIEHLPLGDLMKLLDETLRVLKSGGVAIFETPNPENVHVGSCNFYYDPTHHNPIPPQLLKFLVESKGFSRVQIELLNPYAETSRLSENSSEVVQRFNDYFYGPQDYAVIGFKA